MFIFSQIMQKRFIKICVALFGMVHCFIELDDGKILTGENPIFDIFDGKNHGSL